MRSPHIPLLGAAFAATLILASAAPPALAVSEVAGATFPEQIVQEVTAVQQDEQAVMQTEQQISMLADQAVNLGTMPLQFWSPSSRSRKRRDQLLRRRSFAFSAGAPRGTAASPSLAGAESVPQDQAAYLSRRLRSWWQLHRSCALPCERLTYCPIPCRNAIRNKALSTRAAALRRCPSSFQRWTTCVPERYWSG